LVAFFFPFFFQVSTIKKHIESNAKNKEEKKKKKSIFFMHHICRSCVVLQSQMSNSLVYNQPVEKLPVVCGERHGMAWHGMVG